MHNSQEHITALAFDFGVKKIGVAIGQNLTNTARPLAIIKSQNGEPGYNEIENIIKTWRPNIVVVGIPQEANEPKQKIAVLAENFANSLVEKYQEKYKFKLIMVNEHYTSIEAKQKFIELRKLNLIKQGEDFDHLAACIILERWFGSRY